MNAGLTWEMPGQDMAQIKHNLIVALARSGVCVILEDSRSHYLFVANLLDCWTVDPDRTPSDRSIFGDGLAEQLAAIKSSVRATGDKGEIEVTLGADRYFQFIVEAVPSQEDAADLMTTIVDLSEERQRETVLRTLLREVTHRSKNLLAIIQSITAQTARHSGSLEQFMEKFRGRLYSLSHSQDLITDSSWRGARFNDLVREQLVRYIPETESRIAVEGENTLLSPSASLHLGLALHELIVNSVSHGGLLKRESGITVSCVQVAVNGREMINFSWHEDLSQDDHRKSEQSGKGDGTPHFGSTVLLRVVPASVDGEAYYEVSDDKISYRLAFPAVPDSN